MKKPAAMTKKELGDAHEERVAKALKGRTQTGSGAVRVAMLRGDVIASPFMIECKATAANRITIKYDVWDDVCKKAKETPFKPAYAISTVDEYGNFYDMVGFKREHFTKKLMIAVAPNGILEKFACNKTTTISCVEAAVKSSQYLRVDFFMDDPTTVLYFVSLERLTRVFDKLVEGM